MIELTVALPLYNAKNIAWLALESLCRQKDVNFEWELICAEETTPNPFTKEGVLKYEERLKQVNCKRIEFIELNQKIPLSFKWKLIARKAMDTSIAFLLQAGDCYSQPYRLKESYDLLVKQEYEWISSQIGPFYEINTGLVFLYDLRKRPRTAGLNMGARIELIKNLPDEIKNKSVDSWIVTSITNYLKRAPKRAFNNSDNWKYGFDSHGLNNISKGRSKIMRTKKDIYNGTVDLNQYIDSDILTRIKDCARLVK